MRKLFSLYNTALEKYTYTTQIISSGILFGASDAFCQKIIGKSEKYDWDRTYRFAVFGLLYAPFANKWYAFLNHLATKGFLSNHTLKKKAFAQMFFDQTFFAVLQYSAFYITIAYLQKDGSIKKGIELTKEKLIPTLIPNYLFWPPAQMVNFLYVPLLYKVLYDNFMNFWWNIALSYIAFSM